MYRMMVADYDSPSYFVATAAVKLGFFKKEGVDVEFVAEYGAKHGPERLRVESGQIAEKELRSIPAASAEDNTRAIGRDCEGDVEHIDRQLELAHRGAFDLQRQGNGSLRSCTRLPATRPESEPGRDNH